MIKHNKFKGMSIWEKKPRKEWPLELLERIRKIQREDKKIKRQNPEYAKKDREAYIRCINKDRKKAYKRNEEWRKRNWKKF